MSRTFDELAEAYISVWNQADPTKRRHTIDELWTHNGRYVDPMAAAEGRAEIDSVIESVRSQFPGMTFRLVGPVDGHHNQVRFTWELGPEEGDAPIVGFDVATTDGNGRFDQVLGFLDRVPTS